MMFLAEKMNCCLNFFNELSEAMRETHEVVGSCNRDLSAYLVPEGMASEITYYSKPAFSFRVSDHWNWYANVKKCANERYVQCLCAELPYAHLRKYEGGPSQPIRAASVCAIGNDGKYHVIYGEFWDKKTKTWRWIERSVQEYLNEIGYNKYAC